MINEASIRCFLTLARTLSFTETAKQTFMTQQSVSKYISRLEEDLGYPLFIRTHHYVTMTKAGENFYQLFSRLSTDFEAVKAETGRYYADRGQTLRIGCPDWLDFSAEIEEANRLSPVPQVITEKYPQYELNERFLNRRLDLIITLPALLPKDSSLETTVLTETPLLLLVSPAMHLTSPAEWKTAPLIRAAVDREPLAESRTRARRLCRELNLTPSGVVISPNVESAFTAAEFGQGVLVSTKLTFDALRPKLKSFELGKTEKLLCVRHRVSEQPAAQDYADGLARAFRHAED